MNQAQTDEQAAEAIGFSLSMSSATDVGHVRAINEDSFIAKAPLALVADGMGGHNAGEVASAIVVDEFWPLTGTSLLDPEDVADAMVRAYERIASIVDDSSRSAGTTVAMASMTMHDGAPHWLVMNLGDSRIYRVRDGELTQVSVDHSVVQELVDRGEITEEQARVHPYRNMITRALGAGPDTRPDFFLIPARLDDIFFVCSDGVSGEVDDEEIADIIASTPFERSAHSLVEAALANGGRDNATAVLVKAVRQGDETTHGDDHYTTVDRDSLPHVQQ